MTDSAEILKLRTLLCFLSNHEKYTTVTNIAKVLGKPKYTISRILSELKMEGLIDKSNPRNPILTKEGKEKARIYQERMEILTKYLMFQGVDMECAKKDALYGTLYNSQQFIEMIRVKVAKCYVKEELRHQKQFSGATLCRILQEGIYTFPFVMYQEEGKNGTVISKVNDAFEQACTLCIKQKEGTIFLRSHSNGVLLERIGEQKRGTIEAFQYFDSGNVTYAEKSGTIFSFPAAALQFRNISSKTALMFHGSIPLHMESKWEELAKNVLFTIVI